MKRKNDPKFLEALEGGYVMYNPTESCKHGHNLRYVSTGVCVLCQRGWYNNNRDHHLNNMKKYMKTHAQENRERVAAMYDDKESLHYQIVYTRVALRYALSINDQVRSKSLQKRLESLKAKRDKLKAKKKAAKTANLSKESRNAI